MLVSRTSFPDLNLNSCNKNRIWAFDQKKEAGWSDTSVWRSSEGLVKSREIWSLIISQLPYELRPWMAFSFASSLQHNNESVHLDEWSNFLQEMIQNMKGCLKGLSLLWGQNVGHLLVDISVPYTSYNFSFLILIVEYFSPESLQVMNGTRIKKIPIFSLCLHT